MVNRRRRPLIQVGCRHWNLAVVALTIGNVLLGLRLLQSPECRPSPIAVPPSFHPSPSIHLVNASLFLADPRFARWDSRRLFRFLDHIAVGSKFHELSQISAVCLATQSSLEKLSSIVQVARNWAGPISAAVYAAGDEEYRLLQGYIEYLWRCHPEVSERVSFSVAFPKERVPTGGLTEAVSWKECGKPHPVLTELLSRRSQETMRWRIRNPYPQNHMRNLARKNCHTHQVFLTDVDIIPVAGLAEGLESFFKGIERCPSLCAYVVPTYELDERAPFPANKSQLMRLTKQGLARPFHQKVFIYNQYATNFSRWEDDMTEGGVHISHPVTNFEFLYEPFYVSTDLVPGHDERFLGYGFTRNTQVYETFVAGYQFYVLSPVFTIHWGLQNRKGRPSWRERQNSANRKNLDQFKKEVFAKYQKDPLYMIMKKPNQSPSKLT